MHSQALAKWALIGGAPTVILILLIVRWARHRDSSRWWDVEDLASVMEMLMLPLAVLATVPLFYAHKQPAIRVAVFCLIPAVVFRTILFIVRMVHYRKIAQPEVYRTGMLWSMYVGHMSGMIGIGVYLCVSAIFRGQHFTLTPDARLYTNLTLAYWIGSYLLVRKRSSGDYVSGTLRMLAPCELFGRIREIAARLGGMVDSAYIISKRRFRWVGACACAEDTIALTDELVGSLSKAEVDSIIAHEVGHTLEKNYWKLYYPLSLLAWLAWFTLLIALDNGINRLPGARSFIRYCLWLAAFVVPGLVVKWYHRANERAADRCVDALGDPRAAISAHEKLALANDHPTHRPRWTTLLSTHPALGDCIDTRAREAGLSTEETAHICETARSEFKQNLGDRYHPECYTPTNPELLARPNLGKLPAALGAIIPVSLIALVGCVGLCGSSFSATEAVRMWSIVAGIIVVLAGACFAVKLRIRRVRREFGVQLRTKLSDMYSAANDDMLLVESASIEDWPSTRWHGALLDVTSSELTVLSEGRELHVAISSITSLSPKPRVSSTGVGGVTIEFEREGIPQWLTVRPMRWAEKCRPRDVKELNGWLTDRLIAAGAELRKAEPRLVASRVPAALLIFSATVTLAWLLPAMTGFGGWALLICGMAGCTSGQYLWPWVWAGP